MHTDEYEISLSRELAVCKSTIRRIKKSLELLERKHNKTTGEFVIELRGGVPGPDLNEDSEAWLNSYNSLKKWEELEKQYQDVYFKMKI